MLPLLIPIHPQHTGCIMKVRGVLDPSRKGVQKANTVEDRIVRGADVNTHTLLHAIMTHR